MRIIKQIREKLRDPHFTDIVAVWAFIGFSAAMIVKTW